MKRELIVVFVLGLAGCETSKIERPVADGEKTSSAQSEVIVWNEGASPAQKDLEKKFKKSDSDGGDDMHRWSDERYRDHSPRQMHKPGTVGYEMENKIFTPEIKK